MASSFTGESLYRLNCYLARLLGEEMTPWDELSWDEKIEWDERAHEQNKKED